MYIIYSNTQNCQLKNEVVFLHLCYDGRIQLQHKHLTLYKKTNTKKERKKEKKNTNKNFANKDFISMSLNANKSSITDQKYKKYSTVLLPLGHTKI